LGVNAVSYGNTAIEYAAENNRLEVVKYLEKIPSGIAAPSSLIITGRSDYS